jgi:NIMA (never in mitosis gene a)-related kinase
MAQRSVMQETMDDAWRAAYQPPQYGRRRNPELQITGPSLRSAGARGGGGRAGYAPAADDATTYVSSTSYYTSHR